MDNSRRSDARRAGRRAAALLAALALCAVPAQAGTIFLDTFDDEDAPGVTQLNYRNLKHWVVAGGAVDLISSGAHHIDCVRGKCLDMDGTTARAGTIVSKRVFPAGAYRIRLDISGNQRIPGSDAITVTFGDLTETFVREGKEAFVTVVRPATVGPTGARIVIAHTQDRQDKFGLIIDNVAVEELTLSGDPAPDGDDAAAHGRVLSAARY